MLFLIKVDTMPMAKKISKLPTPPPEYPDLRSSNPDWDKGSEKSKLRIGHSYLAVPAKKKKHHREYDHPGDKRRLRSKRYTEEDPYFEGKVGK